MSELYGEEGVNFFGKRGVNAADPINAKDVVNLRTLYKRLSFITASTTTNTIFISSLGSGYPVYGGQTGDTFGIRSLSAGTNIEIITGDTISYRLKDNVVITSLSAVSISATTFYSGSTDISNYFNIPYYWTSSTGSNSLIQKNGTGNVASGNASIVAGSGNIASGNTSVIGGGINNISTGNTTSILGGKNIIVKGHYSTAVGGQNNILTGTSSFIGAGQSNTLTGNYSFLGGGFNNTLTGNIGTIVGGINNTLNSAYYSVIIGGSTNIIKGVNSVIIGGSNNYTSAAGTNSVIAGGVGNKLYSNCGFIGGGYFNTAKTGVIISGFLNYANSLNSAIFGGRVNNILNLPYNSGNGGKFGIIGGGYYNTAATFFGTIINGKKNYALGDYNTIVGGTYNRVYNTRNSFIGSGNRNIIGQPNTASPIGHNSILNGSYNIIANSSFSSILVGSNNHISGLTNSAIVGGNGITATTYNDCLYTDKINARSLTGTSYARMVVAEVDGLFTLRDISGTTSGLTVSTTNNNGLNTYTGGTDIFQSINISGGSFNNIIASGNSVFNILSAFTLSASTIQSSSLVGGTTQMVVANTAGLLSVQSIPSGGITWTEVTTTSQTAVPDNGYITNNGSLVTITLPTTSAIGKIIRISGSGAGGWKLAQNSGQFVRFGNQVTTTGTAGNLSSIVNYDAIEILCITTDVAWNVISAVGNITIV